MAQARSMDEVVATARLDWLDSPDLAVVWGVALGLNHDVQAVLGRTVEDVQRGAAAPGAYFPMWYGTAGGFGLAAGPGGAPGVSVFSGGAIPDVGGMMSALGTIGNSPSSSGGGGGFGGGGSGGGGGGAGGGF